MIAKNKKQKTILQVLPSLQTGGAEKTTVDISAALVDRGWQSIVVSEGGRMEKDLVSHGATHIRLPLASKNPLTIWQNSRNLIKVINDYKVDLIHARSRSPAWSALWACKQTDTPFVTTYHGAYSQKNRIKAWYNSVMTRSDIIIANSKWTADLIKKRDPSAEDRIVPIYRGTDFSAFSKEGVESDRLSQLKSLWSIQEGDFVFLHLARLSSGKGQKTIIECAARLRAEHSNLRFILAGDHQGRTDYLSELKSMIAQRRLEDCVHLVGHCDDPAAAMAICDAALVASIYAETFGRAAVEASAFEKPVIVTQVGAVAETVLTPPDVPESQRTGWKIAPDNVDSMERAIREMLQMSPERHIQIGQNARNHVVANFSIERMCRETLDVYDKLLD